jgi:hypothetical protein
MGKKLFAVTSALVGLMLGISGDAQARANSAFDGIASNPSEVGCWYHSMGGITNVCSTTRRWCMPLVVDPGGSYWVRVAAYGAGPSNNVGCFATGVNLQRTQHWTTSTGYLPAFGSAQEIYLSGAYVPGGGSLYACCDVNPGGWINNVVWGQ